MSDLFPEKKSVIRTFTGKLMDLASPSFSDIDIRDIAHALAYINRFTGHTAGSYTVAEHAVLCSQFGHPDEALELLMHDASEAYLGDVSSPLKALLPGYRELERKWMTAICLRFGVAGWQTAEVKRIDALMLQAEMEMRLPRQGVPVLQGNPALESEQLLVRMRYALRNPAGVGHKFWEQAFLNRFHELIATRALANIDPNAQVQMEKGE